MLFAFLFNANFTLIESAHSQLFENYNGGYVEGTVGDGWSQSNNDYNYNLNQNYYPTGDTSTLFGNYDGGVVTGSLGDCYYTNCNDNYNTATQNYYPTGDTSTLL
jgi:hypothetical protein